MSKPPTDPAGLLRAALADEPGRPLVTFYDDATGERTELSVKTFDNWVAKTANLLVDGLGAEQGDRVALALPPHWQSAVWLLACWAAGAVPMPVDLPGRAGEPDQAAGEGPRVVVTDAANLAEAMRLFPSADDVVGLSLHPLGGTLTGVLGAPPPAVVVDYATEVRGYGDHFTPVTPVSPDAPALVVEGTKDVLSAAELVGAAAGAAERWGLPDGARVLTTLGFHTLDGVLVNLLAPLTVSGSVIICRNTVETGLDRRLTMEHVTAVAGVAAPGAASRSGRGPLSLLSGASKPPAGPASDHDATPRSEQ